MNKSSTRGLVAGFAGTAIVLSLAACSPATTPTPTPTDSEPAPTTEAESSPDAAAPAEEVTLRFWHNATADPLKGIWDQAARDFEASHEGVTIEVTGYQNEELQRTLIPQALQAGGDAVPDVFMVWPGGEVRAQADAGHLKDLTSVAADTIAELGGVVKPWEVDGKQFALPYAFGITGIWYNTDLFDQAGITDTPKTLPELADAVAKLKDIGVAPIAVGAGDKWPAGHWWYQFALNTCSVETLQTAIPALDFTDPCWIEAGERLQEWMQIEPFQSGFLATSAQQGADSSAGMVANGKAAMEFMGPWNSGQIGSLAPNEEVPAFLGWFPFPSIPGTAGDPTVTMGGGDGFGVYIDAPDVAVEFVQYLVSPEVQKKFGASGAGIPVNPAAADSITDPNLQAIAAATAESSYVQLWLDSALGPEFGNPLNDAIVNLMGGKGTPQDIVDALEKTAANL